AVLEYAREQHEAPVALLMRGRVETIPGVTPTGVRGLAALGEVLAELRLAPDVATGLARYLFSLSSLGQRLLAGVASGDEEAGATAAQLSQLLTLARAFDDQRRQQRETAESGGPSRAATRGGAAWAAFLDYVRVVGLLRQEGAAALDDALAARGDGVRVLTVHASKGLEFPVVYLPGLADRRLPVPPPAERSPAPPPPGAKSGRGAGT